MHLQKGEHAIVLGASMAGLLAARALSETYRQVTIVERDVLPETGVNRRGVPQGRHLHGLHARGRQILDELFPGFSDEIVAHGALTGDSLRNIRWQLSGYQLARGDLGAPGLTMSRPFLEGHVRDRVRALPNVALIEGCDIVGLIPTPDRRRVTGARVHPSDGEEVALTADLVVDATGRGSRTPVWLWELGYLRPRADHIDIGLGYATRTYRLRPGALDGDLLILTAGTPENPRMGVLAEIEGGHHIVTVGGILGDYPPIDPEGFERFVATLPFPDIAEALAGAEPIGDPIPFRFPASVRRRYEQLRRFPAGLLVIGDAVCSFNPVYGQGMTVAALEALALRDLLRNDPVPSPRRWFRRIAKLVDVPWDIAVGADLAFPAVPGTRTAKIRMVNAYLPKLHAAASTDPALAGAFIRVMGMVDRPELLMRPDRVLRVLRATRRAASPAPAPPRRRERVLTP
jgi:2-polyprenyl-6-methoxyphenol hydroxylase-like FAD-dependent oxidoreductase